MHFGAQKIRQDNTRAPMTGFQQSGPKVNGKSRLLSGILVTLLWFLGSCYFAIKPKQYILLYPQGLLKSLEIEGTNKALLPSSLHRVFWSRASLKFIYHFGTSPGTRLLRSEQILGRGFRAGLVLQIRQPTLGQGVMEGLGDWGERERRCTAAL